MNSKHCIRHNGIKIYSVSILKNATKEAGDTSKCITESEIITYGPNTERIFIGGVQ